MGLKADCIQALLVYNGDSLIRGLSFMNIQIELMQAIHLWISDEKSGLSHAVIQEAYNLLQKKYAELKQPLYEIEKPIILNDAMRVAYVLSRMPATFAVASVVIQELRRRVSLEKMRSFLDLGTGTGAMLWALLHSGFNLNHVTALDQDREMLEIAQALMRYHSYFSGQSVQWLQKNLHKSFEVEQHDVVTLSYALIEQNERTFILDKMWGLATQALVIIEPGTSKGFANILFARDYFIQKGGFVVAPCSHKSVCPMKNNNWCHFDERIERTSWQRSLKGASLGYEDEAYSYLIVTKFPVGHEGERILSPPSKRSGHVMLELCAPEEIKKEIVTRKQKDKYLLAKKKNWGDVWGGS